MSGRQAGGRKGGGKGTDCHGSPTGQVMDFGKHVGETYGRIFVRDEDYCGWAVRQMRPRSEGLNNFKYYVMRTNDVGWQGGQGLRRSWESKEVEQRRRLEMSKKCVVHNEEARVIEDILGELREEKRRVTWADTLDEGMEVEEGETAERQEREGNRREMSEQQQEEQEHQEE